MLPVVLAAVPRPVPPASPGSPGRLDLRPAAALRPCDPPAAGIVIVDVDERSLATVGQWPWRRDVVGRLVSRLRDAGAAVIALDVIFAESDRNGRDGEAPGPGAGTSPDEELAAILRQGRVVLGYGLDVRRGAARARSCVLHPLGAAIVRPSGEAGHEPFFRATGVVCNLPMFGRAAIGVRAS